MRKQQGPHTQEGSIIKLFDSVHSTSVRLFPCCDLHVLRLAS